MKTLMDKLKGIKIVKSIIFVWILGLIAMTVIGVEGSINTSRQYNTINEMNTEIIPKIKSWGDVNGNIGLLRNTVTKIIDRDYDQAMVDELYDMNGKIEAIIAQNLAAAQDSPEELKLVQNIDSAYGIYFGYIPEVIELRKNGKPVGKQLAYVEMAKAGNDLSQSIFEIVDYQEKLANEKSQNSEKIYNGGVLLATIIFITSFILLSAISLIAIVVIRRSIRNFTGKLEVVAEGNIAERFDDTLKNEFGTIHQSLNKSLEAISNTLKMIEKDTVRLTNQTQSLSSFSGIMNTTVGEVSIAIQGVSQGSTNQAEELMYMNEAFQSLSHRLEDITESIQTVDDATHKISNKAESSSAELNGLVSSVLGIENSFADTRSKIDSLISSITRVMESTRFISDISKQTNLLSLNASIEASRAGEAGRGFAVVASEIRNLADQSRTSSQDIDELLQEINQEMELVSDTTENTGKILAEQSAIVMTTMESISDIIRSIQLILPQIDGISSSVNELNEHKDKILLTVESTSAVSEENSASAEEISASTIELVGSYNEITKSIQEVEQVSKEMIQAVNRFKLE
ncbi:Methyl-accepting chemotaxis protein McpC [compost metagenome]